MPQKTYKVTIVEQVTAKINYEIKARSAKKAAQIAYDNWVVNGEGELQESVDERHVEVDGEVVEVAEVEE